MAGSGREEALDIIEKASKAGSPASRMWLLHGTVLLDGTAVVDCEPVVADR